MAADVVTSENLTSYNMARVRFPAEDVVDVEAKPVADKVVDALDKANKIAAKEDAKPEGEPEHKKPAIQERFGELTAARKAAEARAEAAEKRIADLEAKAKVAEKPAEPVRDPTAKPKPADFTDAFEYAEALADWSANNALRERDKKDAEARETEKRMKAADDWQGKLKIARAEFADYDDVMAGTELKVSNEVRDALLESDIGPKLAYHLASNPELAERIAGMTPIGALRTIGKLEATLEKPPEKPAPVVEKPAVKRPPAPIAPIRAANVPDDLIDGSGEFTGSFAQWKAMRQSKRMN